MWHSRPPRDPAPPFMANAILNFHFDFLTPSLMCRLGIQELKIRDLGVFEIIDLFSFFLMRKRLSSGQKCFLRPYFPLIRGMIIFRSGIRFSFRALEVLEPEALLDSDYLSFLRCPSFFRYFSFFSFK